MKETILVPLLATLMFAGSAFAQQKMDDMKDMDMGKAPAASAKLKHVAVGVVKKVDAKSGVVTIAHGPVKTMNWPAMMMGFKVRDKMLFDRLADGKNVEIEFVQDGKDYVVTTVK